MQYLMKICLILMLIGQSLHVNAAGFYEQENRYKGFYWFERMPILNKNGSKIEYQIPTASEAEASIEARKASPGKFYR